MDDTILTLPDNATLMLWFDSCIFDQTILMRILYLLNRKRTANPEVFLYCCDGNCLTSEDFESGFTRKIQLFPADIETSGKAWNAFVRKDRDAMLQAADKENFERLPAMKKALLRYADEVPDKNGLTRTQRQILQIVSEKSCSFTEIFKGLDSFEEYPFLGDTACQRLLDELQKRGLLEITQDNRYRLI